MGLIVSLFVVLLTWGVWRMMTKNHPAPDMPEPDGDEFDALERDLNRARFEEMEG